VAAGILVGLVVPAAVAGVLKVRGVGADPMLRPLGPIAVALLIYGTSSLLHANQFLAAFIGGAAVATLRPEASDSFRHTGELISELAKGAALLAFATLIDVAALGLAGWSGLLLAVGVVAVSRPLPLLLAMLGSRLGRRERLAIAWFGPKGFASVAYAVIVAFSDMESADLVLALVMVTVLLSVVAHSSTDVAIARWLTGSGADDEDAPPGSPARG
jgi:NhaP-type Na+/H+ or K+/H+ antiporter